MKYKVRDGVMLRRICGAPFLFADSNAREFCPYIRRINDSGAWLWEFLKEGLSVEQIVKKLTLEYDIQKDAEPAKDIELFIESLAAGGYIELL